MYDIIFIAGAPGSGKSTIAKLLQKKYDSPLFEFGWIPEFRNQGLNQIMYEEEEALSFENLVLVVKNYVKHGFKNIIVTDLNNKYISSLQNSFKGYNYKIITLRLNNKDTLKRRVLNEERSSKYRNWEEAIEINRLLKNRTEFINERFVDIEDEEIEQVFEMVEEAI